MIEENILLLLLLYKTLIINNSYASIFNHADTDSSTYLIEKVNNEAKELSRMMSSRNKTIKKYKNQKPIRITKYYGKIIYRLRFNPLCRIWGSFSGAL